MILLIRVIIWHSLAILCMRAARGLASLRICAGSPESSLLDSAINANTSCDGACALRESANYKGLTPFNWMDFLTLVNWISKFPILGWYFLLLKFYRIFCKQIVKNLIRRHMRSGLFELTFILLMVWSCYTQPAWTLGPLSDR